jgi:hypothetical protein
MCIAIPPKVAVAQGIGFLKGKECDCHCPPVWGQGAQLHG